MYETPKNNINDDDDEDKEPNDLRAKRTQTTTLDDARVEGKIFLKGRKNLPGRTRIRSDFVRADVRLCEGGFPRRRKEEKEEEARERDEQQHDDEQKRK